MKPSNTELTLRGLRYLIDATIETLEKHPTMMDHKEAACNGLLHMIEEAIEELENERITKPPKKQLICPECKATNKRSTVRETGSSSVMGGVDRFFDEDGAYHVHNPVYTKIDFRCSNDHEWVGIGDVLECWCGWESISDAERKYWKAR